MERKSDQCRNTFKSENGLKIHVGKSHKKVTQVQATPDQLRQRPEGPMDTSIIPLLDVRSPASTALIVKEGPALARI